MKNRSFAQARRLAIVAAWAFAATACATMPDTKGAMTVTQLIDTGQSLQGQRVRVAGWLTQCGEQKCLLASARSVGPNDYAIGIGKGLDEKLSPLVGKQIVLEGRFDGECIYYDDPTQLKPACAGRAQSLKEPKILSRTRR